MIYPALLTTVGIASIVILLTFVVPRFATIFEDGRMKIPVPTAIMLDVSKVVTAYWWIAALVITVTVVGLPALHQYGEGADRMGHVASENPYARRCTSQSGDGAFRPGDGYAGGE